VAKVFTGGRTSQVITRVPPLLRAEMCRLVTCLHKECPVLYTRTGQGSAPMRVG
jgi:hypothetical protein